MILLRLSLLSLLSLLLITDLLSTGCWAMDPRFELDPAQVQKKTVSAEEGRKSASKRSRRLAKSHRRHLRCTKTLLKRNSRFSLQSNNIRCSPDQQQIRAFWEKWSQRLAARSH